MPNIRPQLKPGINKSDTSLQTEGGYCDGNRVRFWRGLPQPIGGWSPKTLEHFTGKGRGLHSWAAIGATVVQAFGTNTSLYAFGIGDGIVDITPNLHDTVLTDCFTTISGSSTVTVTLPYHNLAVGDFFTFTNHQATVGGLDIDGTFEVSAVPTRDTFEYDNFNPAGSTEATPTGGNIDFVAPMPVGLEDSRSSGFGVDSFGLDPFGGTAELPKQARVWSIAAWGSRGLFNPSGYGLFEWQPSESYEDLAVNGTFTGSADGWALGAGYTYGAGKITAAAGAGSNLSQNVEGYAKGGKVYRVTFTVTCSAGSIKFQVNAGEVPAVIDVDTASAAITVSGTYTRIFLCPADPVDFLFAKNAAFAGTIDNVSYQLMDKAYRVTTAPPVIDAMFVDPRGLVVALGTTGLDGEYDPSLIRNSALDNLRTWVPATDNIASYQTVKEGGRLMQGVATRQQNFVGSDKGIYSLVYQGVVGAAYKLEKLGENCGLISRHCMSAGAGFVFWMSNTRQFWICRGIGSTSLGAAEVIDCPILEDVFDNLDEQQAIKCFSGINSQFNEFWAWYPDRRDGDECSRVAAYSWTENHWAQHQIERTAWAPKGLLPNPIALGSDGYIYEHEVGTNANGEALNEWVRTSYFDLGEGDTLAQMQGFWPDFKAQTGDVSLVVYSRMYPNGEELESDIYTLSTSTLKADFYITAREISYQMGSGANGTFWRSGAIRIPIIDTGQQR